MMTFDQVEGAARKLDAYGANDGFYYLPPKEALFAAKALRELVTYANRFASWAGQDLLENAFVGNPNHEKLVNAMIREFPLKAIVYGK